MQYFVARNYILRGGWGPSPRDWVFSFTHNTCTTASRWHHLGVEPCRNLLPASDSITHGIPSQDGQSSDSGHFGGGAYAGEMIHGSRLRDRITSTTGVDMYISHYPDLPYPLHPQTDFPHCSFWWPPLCLLPDILNPHHLCFFCMPDTTCATAG